MEADAYDVQPMSGGFNSGHSSEGSLKFQLQHQEIIEDIERGLRGEVLVLDDNGLPQYIKPEGVEPLVNEKGIAKIGVVLRSVLHKGYVLSALELSDIKMIAEDVSYTIIDTLEDYWDDFEIKNASSASTIRQIVSHSVYITLKKSQDGTFLKYLKSTHATTEVQHRTTRDVNAMESQPQPTGLKRLTNKILGRV